MTSDCNRFRLYFLILTVSELLFVNPKFKAKGHILRSAYTYLHFKIWSKMQRLNVLFCFTRKKLYVIKVF